MPEQVHRPIATAYNTFISDRDYIVYLIENNHGDELKPALDSVFHPQIAALVEMNENEIRGNLDVMTRGSYTIESWSHNHTITIIEDKLVISLLSAALVSGDFKKDEE